MRSAFFGAVLSHVVSLQLVLSMLAYAAAHVSPMSAHSQCCLAERSVDSHCHPYLSQMCGSVPAACYGVLPHMDHMHAG